MKSTLVMFNQIWGLFLRNANIDILSMLKKMSLIGAGEVFLKNHYDLSITLLIDDITYQLLLPYISKIKCLYKVVDSFDLNNIIEGDLISLDELFVDLGDQVFITTLNEIVKNKYADYGINTILPNGNIIKMQSAVVDRNSVQINNVFNGYGRVESMSGDYFYLSSLYPRNVNLDGIRFKNFYQALIASKITNRPDRILLSKSGPFYPNNLFKWLNNNNIAFRQQWHDNWDIDILANLLVKNMPSNDIESLSKIQPLPTFKVDADMVKAAQKVIDNDMLDVLMPVVGKIVYVSGNMFNLNGIYTIPVNRVGLMAGGLALGAKTIFPEVEPFYIDACNTDKLNFNQPLLFRTNNGKILLLFATKDDIRYPSKLNWVDEGLRSLNSVLGDIDPNIPLLMPRLGCGFGGLSWSDVRPIMEEHLFNMNREVYVYANG